MNRLTKMLAVLIACCGSFLLGLFAQPFLTPKFTSSEHLGLSDLVGGFVESYAPLPESAQLVGGKRAVKELRSANDYDLSSEENELLSLIQANRVDSSIKLLQQPALSLAKNQRVMQTLQRTLKQAQAENNVELLERWISALNFADLSFAGLQDFEVKTLLDKGKIVAAAELLYNLASRAVDWTEVEALHQDVKELVANSSNRMRSGLLEPKDFKQLLQFVIEKQPEHVPFSIELAKFYELSGDTTTALALLDQLDTYALVAADRGRVSQIRLQWQEQTNNLRANADVVPIQRRGSQVMVTAIIGDVPNFPLMIDTGASLTVLTPDAFRRLSRNARVAPLDPIRVNTANGVVSLNAYLVDYVQVGSSYVENLSIAVADLGEMQGVEGLLGMNYLGKFRFEIDQGSELLYLESR